MDQFLTPTNHHDRRIFGGISGQLGTCLIATNAACLLSFVT